MIRRSSFAALGALFGAWLAAASISPALAAVDPPRAIVEAITPTGYRVRVPLGEPSVTRGQMLGFELAEIDLPGADYEAAPGGPPLPARTVFLRVPWQARPRSTACAQWHTRPRNHSRTAGTGSSGG